MALTEAVLSMMEGMLPEYGALGLVRQPTGSRIPTAAPSNAYPTADGKWILIAANSEPLFAKLAALMGQPDLARDPRFTGNRARVQNVDELDRIIGSLDQAGSTAAEVDRRLSEADIPCTQVYTAAEMRGGPAVPRIAAWCARSRTRSSAGSPPPRRRAPRARRSRRDPLARPADRRAQRTRSCASCSACSRRRSRRSGRKE